MAMVCKKCGGIIPDILRLGEDRNDCSKHQKSKHKYEIGVKA